MAVFTTDPAVIEQGVAYLRIASISFIFFGITTITTRVLCAVQTVNISLGASIVSLITNVFFNWVFIFGNLGAPALGVAAVSYTHLHPYREYLISVESAVPAALYDDSAQRSRDGRVYPFDIQ